MSESTTNGNAATEAATKGDEKTPVTVESTTELAKRAFALGKYEEAVQFYATALELQRDTLGDDAPESADLLFLYGKALLENAIAQSAVLGKEEPATAEEEEDKTTAKKASTFVFGGDAEEDVVEFNQSGAADADEDEGDEDEQEGDEEDGDEPEDDFNAAWEILDYARNMYEKQGSSEEIQLKIAETYIALGDVSLETEKFDQAIADYTSGLELKSSLLPLHHRQIAEAHYKLGLVYDLTSGRLGDAILHVEKAIESIDRRLELLKLTSEGPVEVEGQEQVATNGKGKGKASGAELDANDPIATLSVEQMKTEIKEFEELKQDLYNKIEDLKSAPAGMDQSAPALAAAQLTKELNVAGASSALSNAPVNDLSGMVKKKKKPAAPEAETATPSTSVPAPSNGKRKLEDDEDTTMAGPGPEKKQRLSADAEEATKAA